MRRKGRLRRALAALALLASSTLLTLALFELSLRLFLPQRLRNQPAIYEPHPELLGLPRAGARARYSSPEFDTIWVINRDGHRGPPAGPKVPGTLRVAALGDSFTFGHGVEEEQAYPRVLEGMLRGEGDPPVEVVNLGIGGFGLVQELHWLRYRLDRGLDPDLVILAVTVATDLSDSIREEAALAAREAGLPLQRPRLSALDRTKSFLGRHLHAYTWLADRADWLLVRTGLRELAEGESLEILQVPETAAMARGWKLAGRTLGEFAALARDRTFDLVVMLVPMRHQILPGDWERLRRYHLSLEGTPLDQADLDHPSRRLAALCAEQDLPLLDLTDPFRASPRRDRLYFGRDPHWDVAGHREAASLLAGWIRHRWSPWGAAVRGGGEAKMEEGAE